jgi:hypothetical protein
LPAQEDLFHLVKQQVRYLPREIPIGQPYPDPVCLTKILDLAVSQHQVAPEFLETPVADLALLPLSVGRHHQHDAKIPLGLPLILQS